MDPNKNARETNKREDTLAVPSREDVMTAFQADTDCADVPLEWLLDHCAQRKERDQ